MSDDEWLTPGILAELRQMAETAKRITPDEVPPPSLILALLDGYEAATAEVAPLRADATTPRLTALLAEWDERHRDEESLPGTNNDVLIDTAIRAISRCARELRAAILSADVGVQVTDETRADV